MKRSLPTAATGYAPAELIDLDTALEECGMHILLVDHNVFGAGPSEERDEIKVYDIREIW